MPEGVLTANTLIQWLLRLQPERWIICFDEAFNLGAAWDTTLVDLLKNMDQEFLAKQVYPVIIHQNLEEAKKLLSDCGDLWNKSSIFMRRLVESDEDSFTELRQAEGIAGLDARWDSLQKLDQTSHDFAVSPVLRRSKRYKPIIIHGYPFKKGFFLEPEQKHKLIGKLEWGNRYGRTDIENLLKA
jgi:hypothetical protein